MDTKLRERFGRIVRETWIAWAKEQPDIAEHPHWLTTWDNLAERDKEVDRRIGEVVANDVNAHASSLIGAIAKLDFMRMFDGWWCQMYCTIRSDKKPDEHMPDCPIVLARTLLKQYGVERDH